MKKQEKKFVLAGLALLAITGLLALAGCKNDTVPEPTRYTVKFDKNAEDASGEMQSQIFTEGVEQELSVNQFKRATYTFNGWSEDKAATAPTYKDKAKFKATKDTTLYAVWTDNGTVAPVAFTPAGGALYYGDTVTLSSQEGATIHYTVNDGEEKNGDSPVTVSVTGDTTITARATHAGMVNSAETKATYTVRKLTGITVTPPTQRVYSVGDSFDSSGMVVTATYDDGAQRDVTGLTGLTTDFDSVAATTGLDKNVTVSYSEGATASPNSPTFTVDVTYKFTETVQDVDSGYTGTMGGGRYVKFGDWPQTVMASVVTVDRSRSQTMGIFTSYLGSDGNWYVEQGGSYYKVEPIVWRVLTENYIDADGNGTGNALLLAEKVLTSGFQWDDDSNDYMKSSIRLWLNGNSGVTKFSDYSGAPGFLQSAFTISAQDKIAETTVDNSKVSTNPDKSPTLWQNGENSYVCDDTTDKIFLLSQQEVTAADYGFAAYDEYVGDGNGTSISTRIRVTTDYATASSADNRWWLRSPVYSSGNFVRIISNNGKADFNNNLRVDVTYGGVVPALSISLGGN